MRAPRLLGLLLLALFVAVAAVSAQPGLPPGVKLPTVIKPGGGAGMPQIKPAPPPVKTPPVTGQPGPGGKDPGTGAPGGGTGSGTGAPGFPGGGGGAGDAPKKKDPGNWPKEI